MCFDCLDAQEQLLGDRAVALARSRQVNGGTLQIIGDGASDKLGIQLDPANPSVVNLDVGEDGTTDFSFDTSMFTAIEVQAAGGNDDVRVGNGLSDKALTIDGGLATTRWLATTAATS